MSPSRMRLVRASIQAVAAALVALLAVRLWQQWHADPIDLNRVSVPVSVAAVLVSVAAVASYGSVWPFILRRLGVDAGTSWVTLFFMSQLAKYLPGSVWQYAGRLGLARNRGVAVETALASVIAEVALSAVAAGAIALLVVPRPIAATAACLAAATGGAGALAVRRGRVKLPRILDRGPIRAALRAGPAVGGLYLPVFVLYGLAFWLTTRSLFPVPAGQIPFYTGVFAVAWLAGLAAVFAPGGIGVREAVIVALLSGRLGPAHAIVAAAASRLVLVGVDLAAGGVSFALPLIRRPRPSAGLSR